MSAPWSAPNHGSAETNWAVAKVLGNSSLFGTHGIAKAALRGIRRHRHNSSAERTYSNQSWSNW